MADVSAKDGSQETVVNLTALLCSYNLLPLISGNVQLSWTIYALLTCLHLYANYRAVRALQMENLNQKRFRILFESVHPYFPYDRLVTRLIILLREVVYVLLISVLGIRHDLTLQSICHLYWRRIVWSRYSIGVGRQGGISIWAARSHRLSTAAPILPMTHLHHPNPPMRFASVTMYAMCSV